MNNLGGDVHNWLGARLLEPILYIEGGWEYWLQIDFPAWLDISTGQQYDFRREYTIGNVRLDWIVNETVGGNVFAVNLKAQTTKYVTSKLVSEVKKDIAKLEQVKRQRPTLNCREVVAVIDPAADQELIRLGFARLITYRQRVVVLGKVIGGGNDEAMSTGTSETPLLLAT